MIFVNVVTPTSEGGACAFYVYNIVFSIHYGAKLAWLNVLVGELELNGRFWFWDYFLIFALHKEVDFH